LDRDRLLQNEVPNPTIQVGVQASAQTTVGTDHQYSGPFHRTGRQQRLGPGIVVHGLGGQVGDHALNLDRVRPSFKHGVLGAAHLGRGYE
jgi:hypothetical protein